jgi:hypothetical protein
MYSLRCISIPSPASINQIFLSLHSRLTFPAFFITSVLAHLPDHLLPLQPRLRRHSGQTIGGPTGAGLGFELAVSAEQFFCAGLLPARLRNEVGVVGFELLFHFHRASGH